jgi:hypothetical protein
MDDKESIANVCCFGAFVDKNNGVVYNDLAGSFPFISLDGSICFLVMYHYEANTILAKPISALDNISMFNAYKFQFDDFTSKGIKPKINIMDNQAIKHIICHPWCWTIHPLCWFIHPCCQLVCQDASKLLYGIDMLRLCSC